MGKDSTNKIILIKFVIFIFLSLIIIKKFKFNNIYNNQKLIIIQPKGLCSKTLIFSSKYRKNNINISYNNLIYKTNKFRLKYYLNYNSFKDYLYIFQKHGCLRSHSPFINNSLYIDFLNIKYINKIRENYPINDYQKIYRFIGTKNHFNKDMLYKNYIYMKTLFKNEFNYIPETFYYPKDKKIILQKFKHYLFNLDDLWIVKPINKSGGQGISIFKSLKELNLDRYIISKYISHPNLINNKKYDLRLYILITGLKPLRIYLNKEGLVRFATENYSLDLKSFKNKFIHLTNTDINRKSNKYIYPINTYDEKANIWNINTYKNYLNKINVNFYLVLEKIKDIIIKTIISTVNELIKEMEKIKLSDKNVFYLLGFDILISNTFEPILLEVNFSPSLKLYNNVDKPIKTNIFTDMLNIVGIPSFTNNKTKLDNAFKNDIEDLYNNAMCELSRPRGDFELIFPLKENINRYKKFFIKNNEENIKFWKTIINQEI